MGEEERNGESESHGRYQVIFALSSFEFWPLTMQDVSACQRENKNKTKAYRCATQNSVIFSFADRVL